MPPKQVRRMDRFTQFAVASAKMLLQDAGFEVTEANAYDVAVILGVGLGGLHTLETYHTKLLEAGPNKISPFMIPMLISTWGLQISIFTPAKGPKHRHHHSLRLGHPRCGHGLQRNSAGTGHHRHFRRRGGYGDASGRGRFYGPSRPCPPITTTTPRALPAPLTASATAL